MHRLATSFVLGYHGCAKDIADKVLAGDPFNPSENDYDWLGPGIYFWQANPLRALRFAFEKRRHEGASWAPAVVGAIIDPGLCLDLSTDGGIEQVRKAHTSLVRAFAQARLELPKNAGGDDLLLRKLDCAVVKMLHEIRRANGLEPIDTVTEIFIEGGRLYDSSGFFEKTHVQICVCHTRQIRGVFRVPNADLDA